MKLKRTRIIIEPDLQENTPLFYSYIDAIKIKRVASEVPDYELKHSSLYESFAIIEAPSKLISGIIDYSIINNS